MKDLILNFSWDRLFSLPPSELLAVVVLVVLGLAATAGVLLVLTYFMDN